MRFGRSSTIGLLALAPLDVVVGVILLGVHGGDDVTGLGACVAFTRLADKTPSYCTPFSSIETTSCCSPDSEPNTSTIRRETKGLNWFDHAFGVFFLRQCFWVCYTEWFKDTQISKNWQHFFWVKIYSSVCFMEVKLGQEICCHRFIHSSNHFLFHSIR